MKRPSVGVLTKLLSDSSKPAGYRNLDVDKLDIHAYRYVMKPTLPIRRDSPKKAITLILAVLLGGMVGAGIVLGA